MNEQLKQNRNNLYMPINNLLLLKVLRLRQYPRTFYNEMPSIQAINLRYYHISYLFHPATRRVILELYLSYTGLILELYWRYYKDTIRIQ